jgi:hypothetical protein
MNLDDLAELQQLALFARRRAAAARGLARDRRARAAGALAGRQIAYAEGLLDSACWLEAAAAAEDRRAAMLEAQGARIAVSAPGRAVARTTGASR